MSIVYAAYTIVRAAPNQSHRVCSEASVSPILSVLIGSLVVFAPDPRVAYPPQRVPWPGCDARTAIPPLSCHTMTAARDACVNRGSPSTGLKALRSERIGSDACPGFHHIRAERPPFADASPPYSRDDPRGSPRPRRHRTQRVPVRTLRPRPATDHRGVAVSLSSSVASTSSWCVLQYLYPESVSQPVGL
jgi:hypothetical protein